MSNLPLQITLAPLIRLFQKLWRAPTFTVARFMLKSHLRSGWILGDIIFIWFIYAAFFFNVGGNVAYFYGVVNQALSALAVLSTIVITQRSMTTRVYLPLSKLSSRSAYVRGLLLATGILRGFSFLLTLLLAMSYHQHIPNIGIQDATLSTMLPGALGLLLNTIAISALTIVVYRPIATRLLQIIFLLWCVATLYAGTNNNTFAQFLSIAHAPLIPVTACYYLGTRGIIDLYDLSMLLLVIGYIIALTLLADSLLRKRDLILW